MINYAEAHIPTEQSSASEDTRISRPHGDEKWTFGAEKTPREGTQTSNAVSLLIPYKSLPRIARLRNSMEFREVYESGKRYDGHLMTVFVQANKLDYHRIGITASRKVSLGAVGRNRLKRLLRETFRLSVTTLDSLQVRYDWVLNAKRSLLKMKVAAALRDFHEIIARVECAEHEAFNRTKQQNP